MGAPWGGGSLKAPPPPPPPARAAPAGRGASSGARGVEKPAVRYGINAARPSPRTSRQRAAMGWSDKMVADVDAVLRGVGDLHDGDRKSTRLNSSHSQISYAVFCLKKKKQQKPRHTHSTI